MTALEFHIDFNTKFRRVASNVLSDLEPPEVDWLINDATLKYIEDNFVPKPVLRQGMKPKFQTTKARYSNIESLIERQLLETYKEKNGLYKAVLPYNFFKLVDDSSINSCNEGTLVNKIEYTYMWELDSETVYDNLKISLGSNILFDVSVDLPKLVNGYTDSEDNFYFVSLLLQAINQKGINVYWQQVGNTFKPNTFIFKSYTNDVLKVEYGVDEEETTGYFIKETKTIVSGIGNLYTNRLTTSEDLRYFLTTNFDKPIFDSFLSTIEKGIVNVYTGDYYSQGIELVYVRKPQKLNLELGIVPDISEITHEKIVDLAVERTRVFVETNNLQGLRQIINANNE